MIAAAAALMPGWLWVSLGGLTLTVGDVLFRQYFLTPHAGYFVAGFLAYAAGALALALSYFDKNIVVATVAFITLNVVTFALISYFWFGDEYSIVQVAAIGLGLFVFVLLELV